MTPVPIWTLTGVGLVTGAATLVGGSLVLRFRSALDLFLGFSAGTVIGVALFDLIPESLELAVGKASNLTLTTAVAIGFALYLVVDRTAVIFTRGTAERRHYAPAVLTLHSFLDGLGIGLAFHVSQGAGVIVAIGVLGHDLIDGANTVTLSLSSDDRTSIARGWLAADAIAPLAGILLASVIAVPTFSLPMMLAAFGGFFLYVGATELLPRSLAERPNGSTIAATVLGLVFIYAVIWLASPVR